MQGMIILFLVVVAAAAGFALGRATAPDIVIEKTAVRAVAAATKPLFDCPKTRDQLIDANERANRCAAQLGRQQDDTRAAEQLARAAQEAQQVAVIEAAQLIQREQQNESTKAWASAVVPDAVAASLYTDTGDSCRGNSDGASAGGADGADCPAASVSSAAD
jgi:hypothetical protein